MAGAALRSNALRNLGILAGTLFLVHGAEAQDWRGTARAQGVVIDEAGTAIEGATIRLFFGEDPANGPETVTTNKNGRWLVRRIRPGTFAVHIDADGFVPIADRILVSARSRPGTARHYLQPVPEEVKQANRLAEANNAIGHGNRLVAAGLFAAARSSYVEALGKIEAAARPPILAAMASTFARQDDYTSARRTLDRALAIDPGHEDSLRLLVAVLVAEGNEDEALEVMARLTDRQTEEEER